MKAFRSSNILKTYHFIDEVRCRGTSAEFTKREESDEPCLNFREERHVYFRATYRHLPNELEGESRWGDADTYGHTRKPNKGNRNSKGEEMARGGHFGILDLIIGV